MTTHLSQRTHRLAVLLGTGLLVSACGANDAPRQATIATAYGVATAEARTPPGSLPLQPHRDPRGFTVMKPANWQVMGDDAGQIWIMEPGSGVFALMRAREAGRDMNRWMQRNLMQGERWVRNVRAAAVEPVNASAAKGGYIITDVDGAEKRVNAIAVRHGSIATVFIAAGPVATFERALPTLSAILDSVRFEPQQARGRARALPQMQFEEWRDPVQFAFSVAKPRGWNAFGGLREFGFTADYIFGFASPDNRVMVWHGDPSRETYYLPNPTFESFGWREGGRYTQDNQNFFTVLSVQRLDALAARSLQAMLQAPVRLKGGRARPDIVQQKEAGHRMVGARSSPIADAAEFEFETSDGRSGYVAISISGFSEAAVMGAGTWSVDGFSGYVAPPERQAEGAIALGRLLGTIRTNPQWFAIKNRIDRIDFERIQRFQAEVGQMHEQYMRERAESQAQIQGGRGDVLSGTVEIVDPNTGERATVQNTSRYYFRVTPTPTPGDVVVGTNINENPAPLDLRAMLQVGVDVPYPR
jgi:hypothetical protein